MPRRRVSSPAGPRSRRRAGAPVRAGPAGGDAKARLNRIRELSGLARTTWFGLLAYLGFVGITLLGVEDADFFVPSRQTRLPLVGVEIPTASFFWFAPVLGAALYAYLHLQLVKLWDTLAGLPPRIGDEPAGEHVYPWLVNDLALALRRDGAARPRPLGWLSGLVTRLLVWAAAPLVLAGFWWRSMPAHDEWMTLLIAACLLLSLYVGFTSWSSAAARLRGTDRAPWSGRWKRALGGVAALLIVALSWLRTEGGFDHQVNGAMLAWEAVTERPIFQRDGNADDHAREAWVEANVLTLADLTLRFRPPILEREIVWTPLAPTDLSEGALGWPPPDWRDRDSALRRFREGWCERRKLPEGACRSLRHLWRLPESDERSADRDAWCRAQRLSGERCRDRWTELESAFQVEWEEERGAYLRNLPNPDQPGRDLRGTDLSRAFLAAANLREARLEGAVLRSARLEGANLRRARLQGADLAWARLEESILVGARLQGAYLWRARLDGAVLRGARLEGAELEEARLEGADLGEARLVGANLWGAWLDGAALNWARLEGADLGEAQMNGADLRRARLEGANLVAARLRGADLRHASLNGADLRGARLDGADLRDARLEGADLRRADLRSAIWGAGDIGAAPVHSADLRGAVNLTQAQLASFVGDADTLLPDGTAPDSGAPYFIASCWTDPPESIIALLERASMGIDELREDLRQHWICPPGSEPKKTGTPWPLDAPRPEADPPGSR